MRLYDTFSALARRAAAAARPGPDVLLRPDRLRARAHRQRAAVRRRHVAALVAARDGLRGDSSSTTSPTSTTRSTTPRPARAPSSPRARPSGTSRTRATSGSACPTTCRRRPSRCRRSSQFIEELIESGPRVRGRRRRLLPRRELPRVRPALGPAPGPGRAGRGAEPAQGGSARLRALEGQQAGDRGHLVGLALGPRPAGLAHRVLGDGRGASSGRRSRSTAAGSTSSSRTTRTRSRSRARSGIRSRQIWAHNGMLRFTGEKMSKSVGNVDDDPRGARRVGARGGARLLPRPRPGASRSTSRPETMAQAAARRDTLRNAFTLAGGRRATRPRWAPFRGRARRRLRHARGARGAARLGVDRAAGAAAARARACSASSRSPSATRRRPRSPTLAERRAGRRAPSATSRPSDRLRDELAALGWEMRDEPDGGFTLVRRP